MKLIKTCLVIVIIAIAFLSLKPIDVEIELYVNDKIGHALAYCVLTFLGGLLVEKRKLFIVALAAFVYSALLEYLQGFVPGRMVDWRDLIANASGVIIGVILLFILKEAILNILKRLKLIG
ncbi:MAG TPA: VanZ family protein [Taishania sp.]|nr:VanZ family protein [Taishania sp.]